jgi:hypothetical protein
MDGEGKSSDTYFGSEGVLSYLAMLFYVYSMTSLYLAMLFYVYSMTSLFQKKSYLAFVFHVYSVTS